MPFEYKDGTPIEVGDVVTWTSSGPGKSHKRRGEVMALVNIDVPIRSMIPRSTEMCIGFGDMRGLPKGILECSKVPRVLVAVWDGPHAKPHLMAPVPGSLTKPKKQTL